MRRRKRRLSRPARADRARPRRSRARSTAHHRRAGPASRPRCCRHPRAGQGDRCIGTPATAIAPIAARRRASPRRAGGANATPARRSISRAPIPSSSCSRSTASAACSAVRRAFPRACIRPRRLRRARRDDRRGGAARNPRGGRHRLRRSRLCRLAALAVPVLADDRLPRARRPRATSRSTATSSRTRAGSIARRGASRCSRSATRRAYAAPNPMAIAHHILRYWAEGGGGV